MKKNQKIYQEVYLLGHIKAIFQKRELEEEKDY
jgi:hypothetical protein